MDEPETAELAAEIRLLSGRLARRLRQEGTAGLTPSQLSALASVDRLGPLHLGDLARVESVAPPTLSRAVARLEDSGLLRRRPDPADGRAALVEVTAGGRRALGDLRRARTAFLTQRLEALTADDRRLLAGAVRLLDTVVAAPERPAATPAEPRPAPGPAPARCPAPAGAPAGAGPRPPSGGP
ncbi:MAG: MarR family winged helix-turn-helix transcriptional regulator [Acidimicrobiales bacterium]